MLHSERDGSWTGRYIAAAALAGGALLLCGALQPVVKDQYPFATAYFAVLIAAGYLGAGPALFTAVGGAAGASYYHGHKFGIQRGEVLAGLAFYGIFSITSIWLIERQRRAHSHAEASARVAGERLAQFRVETAHREREEKLTAQLRAVVESSEDAIVSKDLNGVIQSWNAGAERIYGYSADEMIGQHILLLVPPDRSEEENGILDRIRSGGRVKHFETIRRRKDGEMIEVSLTISPIRDSSGRIVGASHIARDITEHKEFEQQLRQSQRLESLGVLAGGLAHDFNNLLTGIIGNASLLLDDYGPSASTEESAREILKAAERAAALVRQMLAYAGKGRFVLERLDIAELVREVAPLIRPTVPSSINLELRLVDGLPPVEGDRAQMQQLIMNLAANAVEAVGEGSGTVTIAVRCREPESEGQVILEVRDTGAGMDEETKARMFDPFFTTKFTGRGLGLAAVNGIIRGHGGTISVESRPGEGSVFTVALPAARLPGSALPELLPEEPWGGVVLVVDDEEMVRNMARFTLERLGYAVELAPDGRKGVELFQAKSAQIAAVVLDLTVPVLNGEEALREIRAIRPSVPVLLSSGFSEQEALRRFRHCRAAGFLQKPYTSAALARKLSEILNARSVAPRRMAS